MLRCCLREDAMKCPLCRDKELVHLDIGARDLVAVMRCPACRGCWVDEVELEKMEAGVWSSVEDMRLSSVEALSELICPRCAARLVTVSPDDHPDLAIDRCPSGHGLWLDSGELARLHDVAVERAAEHGGLHDRPDGWSRLRWVTHRVAERWKRSHEE